MRPPFDRWTWTMAWRDSRRSRGPLFLFLSAMAVGVGALVAIGAFHANLEAAVAQQSRALLGADLRIRSRAEFDDETEQRIRDELIGSLGAQESRQVTFTSMAVFPEVGGTSRVQVRAVSGEYPWYGRLETEPAEAHRSYRAQNGALVDAALLDQFGLGVGTTIRIGVVDYPVAGVLRRIPGESAVNVFSGPRVFVGLDGLDPALTEKGSRVERYAYFKLPDGADAAAIATAWRSFANDKGLRVSTVQSTEESWGRSLEDLTGFLNLTGFIALILGGIGVGSAIHVYVRRKRADVATLRCLGASARATFSIWLVQAFQLGLVAAAIGTALGVLIQLIVPAVVRDLLPIDVELSVRFAPAIGGALLGVVTTLGFALLPLVPLRRTPPLLALRAAGQPVARRDPAALLVALALVLFVLVFGWVQTGEFDVAATFTGALVVVFGLLALAAKGLMALLRRVGPIGLPWVWRQGLKNLHRPNNLTVVLLVSVGLGAFLIMTLLQVRGSLLAEVELATSGNQPNVVLFDVQDRQVEDACKLVEQHGLPVQMKVPIVSMRLAAVKGRSVDELRRDEGRAMSGRALTREYRSTFRDGLFDSEKLLDGEFVGRVEGYGPDAPVPVSVEREQAERLTVTVGDRLDFDVQGISLPAVVASIREVDWRRVQPNFFVVFPAGVLEKAPKFWVVATHAPTPDAVGALLRDASSAFPNVSAIDVTQILQVADEILGKVSFVVHFLAMFSVVTGLLVLVSAVFTSRYQRIEESVLLRTIGATKRQVRRIMNVEYLLLGALATLIGAALAVALGLPLTAWLFEAEFVFQLVPLLLAIAVIGGLTLLVGNLIQRGIHDRPPLEGLRLEA